MSLGDRQRRLRVLLMSLHEKLSVCWAQVATFEQIMVLTADADDSMRSFYWIVWAAGSRPGPETSRLRRDQVLDAIHTGRIGFDDRKLKRAAIRAILYICHYPDQQSVQAELDDWDFRSITDRCSARARAEAEKQIVLETIRSLRKYEQAVTRQTQSLSNQRLTGAVVPGHNQQTS